VVALRWFTPLRFFLSEVVKELLFEFKSLADINGAREVVEAMQEFPRSTTADEENIASYPSRRSTACVSQLGD
jgi:hypothetical protein